VPGCVRVQGRERLRGTFGDGAAAALDAELGKVRAVILFHPHTRSAPVRNDYTQRARSQHWGGVLAMLPLAASAHFACALRNVRSSQCFTKSYCRGVCVWLEAGGPSGDAELACAVGLSVASCASQQVLLAANTQPLAQPTRNRPRSCFYEDKT
jgi:hypothetical protein